MADFRGARTHTLGRDRCCFHRALCWMSNLIRLQAWRSSAWQIPCPHFQFNRALPGFVAAGPCAAERELEWLKVTVARAGFQERFSRWGRISPRRCCFMRPHLFVVINARKLTVLLLFCALKEGEWAYKRRKCLCHKFVLKFRRICIASVGGGCH